MSFSVDYGFVYGLSNSGSPTNDSKRFDVNNNAPRATDVTFTSAYDPQGDGVFTGDGVFEPTFTNQNHSFTTAGADGIFGTADDVDWYTTQRNLDKDSDQDTATSNVTIEGDTEFYYVGNLISFADLYLAVRPDGSIVGTYFDYQENIRTSNGSPGQTDDSSGAGNSLTQAPVDGSAVAGQPAGTTWYRVLNFGEVLGDYWNPKENTTNSDAILATDTNWNQVISDRTEGRLTFFPTNLTLGYIQVGDAGVCFLAGSMISGSEGVLAIEELQIGDWISTTDGPSQVKFVSKNTISVASASESELPICIQAGALGGGLPVADLYVSPGHSIFIDGTLVHASALVNGSTIQQVAPNYFNGQSSFIYYNIELEKHQLITANGCVVESYFDIVPRQDWDNFSDYIRLYGADAPLEELPYQVISEPRQLSASLRLRLQLQEQQAVAA